MHAGCGKFGGHGLGLHRMPVAIEELVREVADATAFERVQDDIVLGFETLEFDDDPANRLGEWKAFTLRCRRSLNELLA